MALSDLAVFSEWTYDTMTEVLRQQVELFNTASRNTITLRVDPITGDYADRAFWELISGLVRRRDPYTTGAVTPKELQHLTETIVKIAAGTPPVNMPPSMFNWIQRSPQEGGVVVGRQLAVANMADMLNTALLASVAALSQVTAVVHDGSSATADIADFNSGQALFGDRYQELVAWVMHSKPLFDVYGAAITNANALFDFGSINVRQDGFGRVFIVTDSASLIDALSPNKYWTLGLVTNAINVSQNNDFTDNIDTRNGDENILRTYQAEWSYNLGIKGFAWDKANGGNAPNNAAIGTSTNWDRIATQTKDLAGVLVKTL